MLTFTDRTDTTPEQNELSKKYANIKILRKLLEDTTTSLYDKSICMIKSYMIDSIKNHFGFEIVVKSPLEYPTHIYSEFMSFIKKYDKNFDKHVKYLRGYDTVLSNSEFIMKLDKNTFCLILSGLRYLNTKSEYEFLSVDSVSKYETYLYIFGKKSYKYYKQVLNIFNNTKDGKLYSLKVTGVADNSNFRVNSSELKTRSIDTIYLENKVTEKIKTHIDGFLKNKPIYDSRNLRYKTGILMQGEPGTGKTSLATAIATEYNCDIVVVDMNSFDEINTTVLSETIDGDDDMYVVLLEDIDCVIGDREDNNIDKEDKALVNKLLQFLDSSSSPTNVIFIATTNHPEKLDSAIKRDGRFDLIVNIKGINKDKTIEMCKSFNISNEALNQILNEIGDNYPVNQSWLQNRILKSFETHTSISA